MQRIPLDQLHEDPDNHPPRDAALVSLLIDAAQGRCKLYLAIVPIQYIRPFSPTYKPTSWEPWLGLLNQSKATLASGLPIFATMADTWRLHFRSDKLAGTPAELSPPDAPVPGSKSPSTATARSPRSRARPTCSPPWV